ncbi:DUF4465 domain-containing protein [Bremerella cremea]|uniref:DUF4465 domain-containing protein n=1 Tax=Bremerella cremea TaxID=1031537 RepID=A0A368KNY8_9BACT|nr:DUF4465 domain-containing protein [Bremerella cremea]RCS42113.1 DUF4465 domain-containing protein [Bremerella cremea]
MRIVAILLLALLSFQHAQAGMVIDFESLPVNSGGYYNGDTSAGAPLRDNYTHLGSAPGSYGGTEHSQVWAAGGVEFSNTYNSDYDSWGGWSWSNVADSTTPGYSNQYASFAGGGSDGAGGSVAGGTYAVGFGSGYINLPSNMSAKSMDITNATYTGLSMQDGDFFSKKFGGDSGNDPDFLRVIFSGFDDLNGTGNLLGSLVVSLADFTFADNSQDFILSDWANIDLTSLGGARSISFSFESSDVGPYGVNTPLYFAIDNFTVEDFSVTPVPEPSMLVLLGSFAAATATLRGFRRKKLARTDEAV